MCKNRPVQVTRATSKFIYFECPYNTYTSSAQVHHTVYLGVCACTAVACADRITCFLVFLSDGCLVVRIVLPRMPRNTATKMASPDSTNKTLKDLIEIYRCLWKIKNKDYHNRDKKAAAQVLIHSLN